MVHSLPLFGWQVSSNDVYLQQLKVTAQGIAEARQPETSSQRFSCGHVELNATRKTGVSMVVDAAAVSHSLRLAEKKECCA